VLQRKETHQLPVQRYDLKNEDGSFTEHYWHTDNSPVLTDEGEVAYIIHTTENITEQVRAGKRELRIKGIEKAYNLFMQAPLGVCIVSSNEHLVELANEHMLQLLGRTKEMVGKPLLDSLTEAKQQGLISILDHVYATGETHHSPAFPAELLINGEREQRYFDLVFQPYYQSPGDQQPSSIFCVAYNITQQVLSQKKVEESEHRFRTLIEEASVATGLYIGKELIVQYANDSLIGYWGKDNSVIGKPLKEAVPELEGQPFLGYLDHVYTTGEPYIGIEEKALLQAHGRLQSFYFNFTYKALRDKQGSIYGIHHMAVDVTTQVIARKKNEESHK
jgi:PAS domain S-box-containing protein